MNIIFASNGLKPEIVITDALENTIKIIKNKEFGLIYDIDIINNNLSWNDLNNWWKRDNKSSLSTRLLSIYENESIEKFFLKSYLNFCNKFDCLKMPALIPEVYLHYDFKTIKQLTLEGKERRLPHQRMDFLLLINGNRVIIELDGKQHYSDGIYSSPSKYATMVKYDREMKFKGYDVFRFGGNEFITENKTQNLEDFFMNLIKRYAPNLLINN